MVVVPVQPVSSSRATGPGGATVQSAHNNHKATANAPGAYRQVEAILSGAVRDQRRVVASVQSHPNRNPGHAEARLLDGMAAGPKPSSVTFNIDWRKKKGKPSDAV